MSVQKQYIVESQIADNLFVENQQNLFNISYRCPFDFNRISFVLNGNVQSTASGLAYLQLVDFNNLVLNLTNNDTKYYDGITILSPLNSNKQLVINLPKGKMQTTGELKFNAQLETLTAADTIIFISLRVIFELVD